MANESPAAVLVTEDGAIVTGDTAGNVSFVVARDPDVVELLGEILDELKRLRQMVAVVTNG